MADHLEQSRADIVVKILGRQLFLTRAGETVMNVVGKLVGGIARYRMDQHGLLLSRDVHAAKTRIHILVVRLEPVAEGRPQHAGSRAWRPAFHHKMLSIKEV